MIKAMAYNISDSPLLSEKARKELKDTEAIIKALHAQAYGCPCGDKFKEYDTKHVITKDGDCFHYKFLECPCGRLKLLE